MGWFDQAFKDIGRAAEDLAHTAKNSVALQVAGAIATGGLSLVAQGIAEAASGKGGPVSGLIEDIGEDPLGVLKQVPGALVSSLTGVGVIGDLAGFAGRQTGAKPLEDAGRILKTTDTVLMEDPGASLSIIGGTVMLVTGAGTAAGIAGIASGTAAIAAKVAVTEIQRDAGEKAAAAQSKSGIGSTSSGPLIGTLTGPLDLRGKQAPKSEGSANLLLAAAGVAAFLVFGM